MDFGLGTFPALAQQNKTDSLKTELQKNLADTTRVNTLNTLAFALYPTNPDSTILLAKQAATLAGRQGWAKGEANAYGIAGIGYAVKGDYPKALDFFFSALKLNEELGDKKGIAARLGNIGNVYEDQGDYPKVLAYYFRALKLDEELGDKKGIAARLGNIGSVYKEQGDYPKALDYYFRSLKLDEELENKNGIAANLGNIGSVYHEQGDYPKASDYYFRSLKLAEELGNKNIIAINLSNIGIVYKEQASAAKSRYGIIGSDPSRQNRDSLCNKASDYYFRALKMNEELGNKKSIAINLGNIGTLYTKTGKFKEAERLLKQAIDIDSAIGAQKNLMDAVGYLSQLYDTTAQLALGSGQYATAAEKFRQSMLHYKKAMVLKDTLFNEEKEKDITRKEMNFEFEKKELAKQAEHDKQISIAEAERKKQVIVIWSIASGLLLVMVFSVLIFRSLRATKRQKAVIEKQKETVDLRNKEIEEQKIQVEKAKEKIEEHQKEIIDSITYAKRLQQAILPPTELIKKHFPESFLIYKPKDIVAGDFYWMEHLTLNPSPREGDLATHETNSSSPSERGQGGEVIFIAAADCTGHGVPGAMVSVVCSNALNRTVKEFGLRDTGKILDKVTDLVLETFEKSGEQIKDGMDISLLKIEFGLGTEPVEVQWSGANNPLWYIAHPTLPKGGLSNAQAKLIEIKGDKQPIGKYDYRKPFTTHNIELPPLLSGGVGGGLFYLFTDGLPDQFGGPKGKKFMYKRFENNLSDICKLPMNEQQIILEKAFVEWKGALEQVDDITVIT